MARRRETVFDALGMVPWWWSLAIGLIGYVVFAYVLPAMWADHILRGTAPATRPVGIVWLVIFVLAAARRAVRSLLLRKKFERQRSIDDIRSLSWRQFESIVGEAFRRRGFSVLENAVAGPDGGVDLVLRRNGERHFVQCKQWKVMKVGVKPIRELYGVMSAGGAAGGFFVTSGTYSADALEFGRKAGIELIDGEALALMITESRSPEQQFDPTTPKRDTTDWSAAVATPDCPKCGNPMVGRTAKRGPNAGSSFWGCSAYPRCTGTRSV